MSLFISSASLAQTPAQPPQSKSEGERASIEVFQGPRPKLKNFRMPSYPVGEKREGNEGWVELCLMVGADGKTFEPAVMRSTGNKVFEGEALNAVKSLTFEPASLNGQPVDSAYEIKFEYRLTPSAHAARSEFIHAYQTLIKAISANDRPAADAALQKLEVNNLFEDAYFGLATYNYAAHWGDDAQQLAGLERAIAGEASAHYLPKDMFAAALQLELQLQLRTQDYGGALIAWERLKKAGIDAQKAESIKRIIDRLETLRTDERQYRVAGKLVDGTWHFHLFKRHFKVAVSEGHVSEIKLRCDKRYVFFAFDPQVRYEVANDHGKCRIELVGEPGTTFSLIQS